MPGVKFPGKSKVKVAALDKTFGQIIHDQIIYFCMKPPVSIVHKLAISRRAETMVANPQEEEIGVKGFTSDWSSIPEDSPETPRA